MSDLKSAAKLALDALEANYLLINGTETHGGLEQCLDGYYSSCFDIDPINKQTEEAIAALKERLARPADPTGQAPCARHCEATAFQIVIKNLRGEIERLKAPQRTWVGLTEQDLDYLCNLAYTGDEEFALAVQAKLMEKNAICSPFMISELWKLHK